MDDDALDVVFLRWWCECWDGPPVRRTEGPTRAKASEGRPTPSWMVRVDGRAVCDARALLDLSDATFDLPPTEGLFPCAGESIATLICGCKASDRRPPWNVRADGVFLFTRDFDESLVIRASKIEQWLDKWTPLWRLSRMSAIDAAGDTPMNEGA